MLAMALVPSRAAAEDVVGRLLKDTVATFSDSYDLLYYSLKSALRRDLRDQAQAVQMTRETTNERIEAYLEAKGILLRRDSQPITRRDFARILIERFDLPKGFFTRLTGSSGWYFRDAVRAGLFSENDAGEGTMSTREMLSVFTRAEQLSRSR
ncbi:MAG: hypothetical protein OHK0011_06340 [Turneriella sp.]